MKGQKQKNYGVAIVQMYSWEFKIVKSDMLLKEDFRGNGVAQSVG